MSNDFDMFDVRKRLADIESGKHGEKYHHVFDLVHAVHHKLTRIAKSTAANVNQGLHNRIPEGSLSFRVIATPDLHPHLLSRGDKDHDWETISRYTKLKFTEFAPDGTSVKVGTEVRARVSDHLNLDEDSKIVWVEFDINKYIMVRSADGKEYAWKSLSWKPQKVDLMNGRNTPVDPKAGRGGTIIVKPTFYIRPDNMRKIQSDARKRIPEAIHNGANELIKDKWEEAEGGSASSS